VPVNPPIERIRSRRVPPLFRLDSALQPRTNSRDRAFSSCSFGDFAVRASQADRQEFHTPVHRLGLPHAHLDLQVRILVTAGTFNAFMPRIAAS
jgi:hypothetical protein